MPDTEAKDWYYASPENEKIGPIGLRDLTDLAGRGIIKATTLVWNPEQPTWVPAGEISHLLTKEPVPSAPEVRIAELAPLPPRDLKPRRGSFLFRRIFVGVNASLTLAAIVAGFLYFTEISSPWFALAILPIGIIFTLLSAFAVYRKERYELRETRLICHQGGLFSDQTTEFEIRNITHVKIKLPWLRFKLFGVGDVKIETAGNAKPMVMHLIHEPEAIYAAIRELMKRNGYELSQNELLHQGKPAVIGIFGEVAGFLVSSVVLVFFSFGGLIALFNNLDSNKSHLIIIALSSLLAIGILIFITIRFLDFRRRTYSVYNDVVIYEEGFLTRENAFIPYENIADANTKSSFFDQIFGLSDVQVSCQGSSSEIKFRRLKNGATLSDAIDRLVEFASKKTRHIPSKTNDVVSAEKRVRREEPDLTPAGIVPVAELRMNGGRLLVPLLFLLPLFPLWIIAMVKALVRLSSTRYFVRSSSLRHSYRFLNIHEREFSFEKITGLVIGTNLWDKMFGTMTLKFWSIGSGEPLVFAHVHHSQVQLPLLLQQIGIPAASEQPYRAETSFGFLTWLRAKIYWIPMILLIIGGTIVLALETDKRFLYFLTIPFAYAIAAFVHGKLYYSRQHLFFHDHHVEAEQGIIAKRRYLVRYKNIKRIHTTRFPSGNVGNLKIFVAGEEKIFEQAQEVKGRKPLLKQCSFTTGFLPEISRAGLLLSDILCGKVDPSPTAQPAEICEPLIESRRSISNAVSKTVLLSVIIFPLFVLLAISLPLTILRIKRWCYLVDESRIAMRWGLFFRKEESVILDRVDSLSQNQGPLNKIFRNGKVSIMTAGSSKPDLVIKDSPRYLDLYNAIRDRSQ